MRAATGSQWSSMSSGLSLGCHVSRTPDPPATISPTPSLLAQPCQLRMLLLLLPSPISHPRPRLHLPSPPPVPGSPRPAPTPQLPRRSEEDGKFPLSETMRRRPPESPSVTVAVFVSFPPPPPPSPPPPPPPPTQRALFFS